MNCPVKTDPLPDEGFNQNPPSFPPELSTNNTLNHRANDTQNRRIRIDLEDGSHGSLDPSERICEAESSIPMEAAPGEANRKEDYEVTVQKIRTTTLDKGHNSNPPPTSPSLVARNALKVRNILAKYAKFIGPGFMVSVAYIDPGNYATDVAAGATYRFKLLFMILISNIFAIFLQSLCIKLGTVTGLNLAENCRKHLPRWLNYVLYGFAEAAVIATDIAEVIGTAIALNLLFKLPLVAGCAISILDVMIILFFYNPSGMSMRALRIFEIFVMLLVLGVVICFCWELTFIKDTSVGEVFRGYLPSKAIIESKGLYQSCGILGATVMPHSLYLGSGIVQRRLQDFDEHHPRPGSTSNPASTTPVEPRISHESLSTHHSTEPKYRPSLRAIKACMSYSIAELAISLFTFALFVNSAILIVSGASLSNLPEEDTSSADLFSIHSLLATTLAPAAGTIFALALLLSGTSAGIVCTIAGQMVSEGMLNWHVKPWIRRILTRSISIIPSVVVAAGVGREGLSRALEASQVALSVLLPFVSAPLIWFTCRSSVMCVFAEDESPDGQEGENRDAEGNPRGRLVIMRNNWVTASLAIVIWGVIVVMNVALLVLVAKGE